MGLSTPPPRLSRLTRLSELHHRLPKERVTKSARGDFRANWPGERRQGRLCTVDIRREPREPGGNPPVRAPQGLDTQNTAGEWWARQDSNLQPDRYERPALTS